MKNQYFKKYESKFERKAQKAVQYEIRRAKEKAHLNTLEDDDKSDREYLHNEYQNESSES